MMEHKQDNTDTILGAFTGFKDDVTEKATSKFTNYALIAVAAILGVMAVNKK